LSLPIDTTAKMYELSVKSTYTVSPLISLATVPGLGSVPGLGLPVTLSFTANRPVEHPGGYQPSGTVAGGGVVPPFNRVASNPASPGPPTPVTWRTPGIFQQIAAAGETVASVTVLTVPGNSDWVHSGVTLTGTQQVWIDSTAVGLWGLNGAFGDANGDYSSSANSGNLSLMYFSGSTGGNTAALDSLIGCIGPTPPTVLNSGPPSGFNMFEVGDVLTNYPINLGGALAFRMNDNDNLEMASARKAEGMTTNLGQQLVRIIVTY